MRGGGLEKRERKKERVERDQRQQEPCQGEEKEEKSRFARNWHKNCFRKALCLRRAFEKLGHGLSSQRAFEESGDLAAKRSHANPNVAT